MKKTIKTTVAIMLAMIVACMPLASLASAAVQTITGSHEIIVHYERAYGFEPGKEYVIVSDDITGEGHALTASTDSSYLSATHVTVSGAETPQVIAYELDDAMVWTAVEDSHGFIYLRNNLTGRYLGTLSGLYTWYSMYAADSLNYTRSGLSLNNSSYYGSFIDFDGTNFVLRANNQVNYSTYAGIFEKVETAILLTPFED